MEQSTVNSAEELTDEKVEQAMDELNIEKEFRDENDQTFVEDAPAQEGQGTGELSYLDELERLAKLKGAGIITAVDFKAKKKQLLGL